MECKASPEYLRGLGPCIMASINVIGPFSWPDPVPTSQEFLQEVLDRKILRTENLPTP